MPKDPYERRAEESEDVLEKVMHSPAEADDPMAMLTRLLSALDARRRSHETLAIERCAQALQRESH